MIEFSIKIQESYIISNIHYQKFRRTHNGQTGTCKEQWKAVKDSKEKDQIAYKVKGAGKSTLV